jgi:hypothetical protein
MGLPDILNLTSQKSFLPFPAEARLKESKA